MLGSLENSTPGKDRTAAPIGRGTLGGRDRLYRQSGSREPSCGRRKGLQREREGEGEKGMEVQSQGADSPAGRVSGKLGASLPSESPGGTRALRVPWSVWLCHLAGDVAEEVI